jgi:actin-like ATPase involved in cell morphogenesis
MTMNRIVETDSPETFVEEMEKLQEGLPRRIDANPNNVEKGLAKLVLTLVELIRRLLEKQAMRRIEAGSLSDDQIERVGETLMKLEKKMQELQQVFGLTNEELNINLGPLGDLM